VARVVVASPKNRPPLITSVVPPVDGRLGVQKVKKGATVATAEGAI
jgi:hypothetical protein